MTATCSRRQALKLIGARTGRSAVPAAPAGYPALLAALRRITTEENVRKIAGENWLRVLAQAKVG